MAMKMTSRGKIKTLKSDCEEDGGGGGDDDEQQDENERSE
jgi:hypothetical protein